MKPGFQRSFISFLRVIKYGFLNFFRNAWLSTAATAIMLVTLMITISTLTANRAMDDTIKRLAEDITISVFLSDEEGNEQLLEQLQSELRNNEQVKSLVFISKEQAQQDYLDRYAGDQLLLDAIAVVGNTFPASYEVELFDLSENEEVVSIVEKEEYQPVVDEFDQDRLNTINRIGNAQDFIVKAGIVMGLLFGGISILVIFNTIRMAIFTRANEIKIMRLIGATNSFIRGPFLFEAAFYGVISGVIASGLSYSLLKAVGPGLNKHIYFDPTIAFVEQNALLLVLAVIGSGILIGVTSSLLAMARYMKL